MLIPGTSVQNFKLILRTLNFLRSLIRDSIWQIIKILSGVYFDGVFSILNFLRNKMIISESELLRPFRLKRVPLGLVARNPYSAFDGEFSGPSFTATKPAKNLYKMF